MSKKSNTRVNTAVSILNEADLATIAALEPALMTLMIDAPADPEVEQVLAEIQAEAVANETPAEAEVVEAPAEPEWVDTRSVTEILMEQTDGKRDEVLVQIGANFDERAAFETSHNPTNSNIHDTLKKQRTKMALPGIAALMLATQTSPDVINRSISEGKRFNVYAVDKLSDLLHGLNSGHFKNAINIAVMRSLFKFRKAGITFTGELALAAASDKVKVDKAMNAILIRHTVSAATAPTQASSTMSALAAIGAVKNKGTVKFPIWELTNKPVVRALEAKFAA